MYKANLIKRLSCIRIYLALGGTNVLPEVFDHSKPGALESITISTNSSSPNVAEYDGILYVGLGVNGSRKLWINGVMFGCISGSDGGADSYELKKGDVFYGNSGINFAYIAYYKTHKIIKATASTDSYTPPSSEIQEIESYFDNGINTIKNNGLSYSTEEKATGGTWIDGKPIYRKVLTNINASSSTKTVQLGFTIGTLIGGTMLVEKMSGGNVQYYGVTSIGQIDGAYIDGRLTASKNSMEFYVNNSSQYIRTCTIEYTKAD